MIERPEYEDIYDINTNRFSDIIISGRHLNLIIKSLPIKYGDGYYIFKGFKDNLPKLRKSILVESLYEIWSKDKDAFFELCEIKEDWFKQSMQPIKIFIDMFLTSDFNEQREKTLSVVFKFFHGSNIDYVHKIDTMTNQRLNYL